MQTLASDVANPLLGQDLAQLSRQLGCRIDLLREGVQLGVVVRGFRLPTGLYNKPTTDLLMQTTTQYPASEMDMFWVDEDLVLVDGRMPQGGESVETHFGSRWRRYSWHRNAPWQPGRDNLVGHFEFAVARLQRAQ